MKTVELGSVATIERKGVDPRAVAPETFYIGLEHIERGGRIIGHDTVAGAELASTKFQFSPEHVLFGKLRPNLGKVSRPQFAGVCSTDILPIRPGKDLDRNYLAHYLAQPSMVDFAASRTSGANLPRLSPTVLATFPVPLPHLPEQRRIAAILDQAAVLRAKRCQVLAHLDTLTQSIFQEMFGDLSADTELADACSRITDGTHQSPTWEESGIPFLFISNITSGEINLTTKKFVSDSTWRDLTRRTPIEPGDVLYSTVGVTFGIPAVVRTSQRFAFQRHIAHIKPDRDVLHADFLASQLASAPLKRQATRAAKGAAQPTVNLADIKKFKIVLPPLARQEDFAQRVSVVSRQRAAVLAAQTADDELFSSLQSRAFRGEL